MHLRQRISRRWLSTTLRQNPFELNLRNTSWLDHHDHDDATVKNHATYKNWINGQFVTPSVVQPPHQQQCQMIQNPADSRQVMGCVLDTSYPEIDAAITSAQEAFYEWKDVPVQQRQRVMLEYQRLIRHNTDDVAYWITLENGKTLADARGDVIRGLEVVESACNVADKVLGESLANISRHMDCITYRQPLGVCAGIAPFNFPAMIPLWMFPLACTVGNAFVLKPSEKTPSAALFLAELAHQAGLPRGLLQVIQGGRSVVDALCDHPLIQAISFVGSNVAGESIYAKATSSTGKRVQANLGAKNHAVVLPDADPISTISALVGAGFGAAGQRCMALSCVVFVKGNHGPTLEEWISQLVTKAKQLKVGNGMHDGIDIGPLITPESKQRVTSIITQAIEQGATIELDGRDHHHHGIHKQNDEETHAYGNYLGPTILSNVTKSNIAYQTEIFGPVLCIREEATSLEEAIAMIHQDNPYGNGCALFTTSGSAARQFTHQITVGQVGINVPIPVPLPMFSFTGNRASIRGDINFYGKQGIAFYTQTKTVTSYWPPQNHVKDKVDRALGGVTMPTMGHSSPSSSTTTTTKR